MAQQPRHREIQRSEVQRGDIFSVGFDPARGSEQAGTRPALVIQNDVGNHFSPTVIVAAITSGNRVRFPMYVEVKAPEGGLPNNSLIMLNQILTVDKTRLGEYWGRLSPEIMAKVDEAIAISLGLTPV